MTVIITETLKDPCWSVAIACISFFFLFLSMTWLSFFFYNDSYDQRPSNPTVSQSPELPCRYSRQEHGKRKLILMLLYYCVSLILWPFIIPLWPAARSQCSWDDGVSGTCRDQPSIQETSAAFRDYLTTRQPVAMSSCHLTSDGNLRTSCCLKTWPVC